MALLHSGRASSGLSDGVSGLVRNAILTRFPPAVERPENPPPRCPVSGLVISAQFCAGQRVSCLDPGRRTEIERLVASPWAARPSDSIERDGLRAPGWFNLGTDLNKT